MSDRSPQRYGREPRSAEPDLGEPDLTGPDLGETDGPDFAGEHSDVTLAEDRRGGPERAPDESVPRGLAGADPTSER